jgi:hypothetical protein
MTWFERSRLSVLEGWLAGGYAGPKILPCFFLRRNPLREIATDVPRVDVLLYAPRVGFHTDKEQKMDLAMMMAVAIFGLFGASTAIFLYKLEP